MPQPSASAPEAPVSSAAIIVVFDTADPRQAALLAAFVASFGEGHALPDDLDPPERRCLRVLPGGAKRLGAPPGYRGEGSM